MNNFFCDDFRIDRVDILKIKNLVRAVGIPVNIVGYKYIVDSLIYMIHTSKAMLLNEVYSFVAKNNDTSVECVEVSIRNAIKKSCVLRNEQHGNVFDINNDKTLSNSMFLNILKENALENIYLN